MQPFLQAMGPGINTLSGSSMMMPPSSLPPQQQQQQQLSGGSGGSGGVSGKRAGLEPPSGGSDDTGKHVGAGDGGAGVVRCADLHLFYLICQCLSSALLDAWLCLCLEGCLNNTFISNLSTRVTHYYQRT